MYKKRNLIYLVILVLCLFFAFTGLANANARDDVVNYAESILNYTWSTNGYVLLYYNAYNPTSSGNYINFNGSNPVVATSTIRGIPYTLSSNNTGNGSEKTFSQYKNLSNSEKLALSDVYTYDGGNRVSMKYGMSCATFVTDCILQGLTGKGLYTYAVTDIHSQNGWSNYITAGDLNDSDYSALQKGDYLYKSSHVMLVVDNDGSTITVIEQTPPDYTRNNCSNKKTGVTITLTHNGESHTYYNATQVCMQCNACRQATTGTKKSDWSYSSLRSYGYYPMYVAYDEPDLPWDGSYYLTGMTPSSYAHIYTLENKTYDVYSDKFLRNKLKQNWTDGTEEDYLIGVGKNSEGVYYAHISIPRDDGGRKNVYVNLKDVFIKGSIDEAPNVYYDTRSYYRRPGSDPDSSYYTKVGDTIFRLTNDNGWSQVAFWDNGTGCIRIAWLKNSEYQRITTPPPSGIKIDSTNFPDDLFREYVSNWDKDGNGYFSDSEINEITDFGWHGGPHPDNVNPNAWSGWEPKSVLVDNGSKWAGIKSIQGIKYFKNLEWLYVYNDNITEIDVSGMTKLGDLRCYKNKITSINVSGCTALVHLECQNNQISTLNLSGCSALKYLDVSYNPITSWNITGCTKLEEVIVKGTNFKTLNISNLSSLKKLDVTWCEYLTELYCYNNSLTSLGINSCESLRTLYCRDNKLTELNIAFCPAMTTVECQNNNIGLIFFAGGSTVINNMVNLKRDSNVTVKVNSQIATAPTITTTSMPNATVGQSYRATIQATGTGTIWYSGTANVIANGFLFDGNKLECTTGIINGTPKYERESFSFPVTAENFMGRTTKTFTIKISPAGVKPTITTTSPLSSGTEGTSYNYTLSATGTTPITWSLYSGSLPKGLSLSSAGKISGTPTSADTYSFTLKASNNYGYDTKSFKLTINGVSPTITTTSPLTSGTEGKSYSFTPLATGTKAITWSKYSGTLPSGLSISSSTGTISGTPTSADTYSFTLKAANKWGSTTKTFKLTINGVSPTITTTSPLPFGTEGKLYNRQLEATGTAPITWSIYSGSLPSGLSLGSSTGIISGTTTTAGTYNFTVRASNKWGSINKTFELSVSEAPSVSIEVVSPGKFVGDYYEAKINANFSISSCTISSGSLPPNLTLKKVSDSQYSISGYLTKAGVFSFSLKIMNSTGSFTKTFSMTVEEDGIKIDAENFPDATFRKYISDNFDKDHNGYLSDEELAAVKNIDVDSKGISSLEGIEFFTELTNLSCNSNNIKSLDLSDNTKLKYLYCNSNALTELILGENSALKYVDCQNNPDLYYLDVSGCSNLSNTSIQHDPQTEIDEGKPKPSFSSFALSLEDRIAVVFYFHLPDGIDYSDVNKYYMEFDIKGGTSNKESREKYDPALSYTSSKSGKTYYGFKCYINSAQMAENITATFHFNGETVSATSSVKEYLDTALESPSELGFTEKQINLMYAIMDYGHYSQAMLAKKNSQVNQYVKMPEATEYTDNDIAEVKKKAANYAVQAYSNISKEKMSGISVSLNLDSQTTLSVHYNLSSNYNGSVSATIDGNTVNATAEGVTGDGTKRQYKVSLPKIASNQLGKVHIINLIADGMMNNVVASGLSYVDLVFRFPDGSYVDGVDIDTMRRAVVALFNYYEAAKACFPTE